VLEARTPVNEERGPFVSARADTNLAALGSCPINPRFASQQRQWRAVSAVFRSNKSRNQRLYALIAAFDKSAKRLRCGDWGLTCFDDKRYSGEAQ
jgi:hypothetical protein